MIHKANFYKKKKGTTVKIEIITGFAKESVSKDNRLLYYFVATKKEKDSNSYEPVFVYERFSKIEINSKKAIKYYKFGLRECINNAVIRAHEELKPISVNLFL